MLVYYFFSRIIHLVFLIIFQGLCISITVSLGEIHSQVRFIIFLYTFPKFVWLTFSFVMLVMSINFKWYIFLGDFWVYIMHSLHEDMRIKTDSSFSDPFKAERGVRFNPY